jgi:hypothetical protein
MYITSQQVFSLRNKEKPNKNINHGIAHECLRIMVVYKVVQEILDSNIQITTWNDVSCLLIGIWISISFLILYALHLFHVIVIETLNQTGHVI